jgi:hypothetical protein
MKLFLVVGKVRITHYMIDEPRIMASTKPVYAHSAQEAETKFREFWEAKTEPYDVYYNVLSCDTDEAIE